MKLTIQGNPLFLQIWDSENRITANQGGARSGKTYAILQRLIAACIAQPNQNLTFTIVRKAMPSARSSVMRDFFSILEEYNLYHPNHHSKTHNTYNLFGNTFEFTGIDSAQKKRGTKRDYLFLNEANELTYQDWLQLNLRTKAKIYLDYNPSARSHWIYSKLLVREDCTFIKSTYRDNEFLAKEIAYEIEALKETDPESWNIFGNGERAFSMADIYPHWDNDYKEGPWDNFCYGLDFGYNVPSSLVLVAARERDLYWKEEFYQSRLNPDELLALLKSTIPLKYKRKPIYADSADSGIIDVIKKAGYIVRKANKSVLDGILTVKNYKIHIHPKSINGMNEIQEYAWEADNNGGYLEYPVKKNDHFLDAARYGTLGLARNPGKFQWTLIGSDPDDTRYVR